MQTRGYHTNRPTEGPAMQIVLDVAESAAQVTFGLLLSGPGEVWIGRATLEVVDKSVPATGI